MPFLTSEAEQGNLLIDDNSQGKEKTEAAGCCSCDCCSSAFNVLKWKGDRIFWQLQRGPAPWASEQYMLVSL